MCFFLCFSTIAFGLSDNHLESQLLLIESFLKADDSPNVPQRYRDIIEQGVLVHHPNAIILKAELLFRAGKKQEAVSLLAAQENSEIQKVLVDWYLYLTPVKDILKGLRILEEQSEAGNVEFQLYYATLLERGEVVAYNAKKALFFLRTAAQKNYLPALHMLGEVYLQKRLQTNAPNKALYWFEKAAFAGHGVSRYNLSLMYLKGQFVTQSITKAYLWSCLSSFEQAQMLCNNIEQYLDATQKKNTQALLEKFKKYQQN